MENDLFVIWQRHDEAMRVRITSDYRIEVGCPPLCYGWGDTPEQVISLCDTHALSLVRMLTKAVKALRKLEKSRKPSWIAESYPAAEELPAGALD